MQDYGSILIQTNSADRAHKYSQIMFFIRGSGCDKGLTLQCGIMLTNGWAESIVVRRETLHCPPGLAPRICATVASTHTDHPHTDYRLERPTVSSTPSPPLITVTVLLLIHHSIGRRIIAVPDDTSNLGVMMPISLGVKVWRPLVGSPRNKCFHP